MRENLENYSAASPNLFGERLGIAIGKLGKTRAEVGSWVGLSSQAVSAWMTRNTSIKLVDAAMIAYRLGVSLDWLTGLDSGENSLTEKEQALLEASRAIEREGARTVLAKLKSESPKPEYSVPLGPAIAMPAFTREANGSED